MQQSLTNAVSVGSTYRDRMCNLDHEEVWAVFLNGGLSILCEMMLSKGTLTQTSIDCRTVLRNALLVNATALILLHNHPSGDPRPSQGDILFTHNLKKACSLLDIRLVDHVIVTADSFFSFAEERILKY